MKKTILTFIIMAALVLSLAGCGSLPPAENKAPVDETQAAPEAQSPAAEDTQIVVEESPEIPAEPGREDGERFETTIMMEGMEEPVSYEHLKNTALGFEMDYDYENFVRRSEADRELFISDWDDPENPENYLEVRSDADDYSLVADAVSAALSEEYDPLWFTRELDHGGSAIRIEGSVIKGTNRMADHLQAVYIIPAGSGCIVATAHYAIEGAEGFGRRFSCMVKTLEALNGKENVSLSEEQALTAIQNYCYGGNPDLKDIVNAGEYEVYWDIASSDEQQIVVLFRSYTGAQNRYYIDRVTGETFVTEFVPGITTEEQRTEESFNAWEYVGCGILNIG